MGLLNETVELDPIDTSNGDLVRAKKDAKIRNNHLNNMPTEGECRMQWFWILKFLCISVHDKV